MSLEEFVKQLDAISEHGGVPYGRAYLLFDEEEKHSQAVLKYKGYLALSDAFKCFFLETVEFVNTYCRPKVTTPLSEFYGLFVTRLVHSFKSLCGAERLAIRGYPYHAYTLLRNTFDNLVLTSAALQKITDFYSIEGIDPGKPLDPNAARKLRKATEYRVRRQMVGNQSGLTQVTIDELSRWDTLFDYEVHGAQLSMVAVQGWLKGTAPLPVLPVFEETPFVMFVNRFCEIGWMAHKLFPLVQPPEAPLPEAWKNKCRVMDNCFEYAVDSLTKELGKKIGAAIVEFVKAKFPFNELSTFPL